MDYEGITAEEKAELYEYYESKNLDTCEVTQAIRHLDKVGTPTVMCINEGFNRLMKRLEGDKKHE